MATGDIVYKQSQLIDDAYITIVPSTAEEHYIIHNIVFPFGRTCELYHTDGTNDILIATSGFSFLSYNLHVSTTSYYKLKNVSGFTIYASYDGIEV